jgi:hypothetical protein
MNHDLDDFKGLGGKVKLNRINVVQECDAMNDD